jgi:hypothetical protein
MSRLPSTRAQGAKSKEKRYSYFFKHGMDILRQHSKKPTLSWIGGASRDRTDDLKLAKLPLSQLSYGPDPKDGLNTYQERCSSARSGVTTDFLKRERVVGLGRFELPTSRLSSARSNQLSYRP